MTNLPLSEDTLTRHKLARYFLELSADLIDGNVDIEDFDLYEETERDFSYDPVYTGKTIITMRIKKHGV